METCIICKTEIAAIGNLCVYCYENYVKDERYDNLSRANYDFDYGDDKY